MEDTPTRGCIHITYSFASTSIKVEHMFNSECFEDDIARAIECLNSEINRLQGMLEEKSHE